MKKLDKKRKVEYCDVYIASGGKLIWLTRKKDSQFRVEAIIQLVRLKDVFSYYVILGNLPFSDIPPKYIVGDFELVKFLLKSKYRILGLCKHVYSVKSPKTLKVISKILNQVLHPNDDRNTPHILFPIPTLTKLPRL